MYNHHANLLIRTQYKLHIVLQAGIIGLQNYDSDITYLMVSLVMKYCCLLLMFFPEQIPISQDLPVELMKILLKYKA